MVQESRAGVARMKPFEQEGTSSGLDQCITMDDALRDSMVPMQNGTLGENMRVNHAV